MNSNQEIEYVAYLYYSVEGGPLPALKTRSGAIILVALLLKDFLKTQHQLSRV